MHWIALPLPWLDESVARREGAGAVGPAPAAAGSGAAPMSPSPLVAAAAGWWALRFTPRVALVDGDTVLLEVSSTERLWGGPDVLLALVLQAWSDACVGLADAAAGDDVGGQTADPPTTVWGCGPTALVAQALLRMAQAAESRRPHGPRASEGSHKKTALVDWPQAISPLSDSALKGLPLHTLTALRPHVASLEHMGCRTWGSLHALPRAGVARRFGAGVLRVLDQALGDAPEAHRWLELPEQFVLATELPALAESADALLWSANRTLLSALQGWLQGRQQGALALELAWRHDLRRIDGVLIAPAQALQVRTAQATQDMAHLRRLLSENLARTALAAPVNQITLRLLESALLPHRSASLLPPGDRGAAHDHSSDVQGEALHQLLERLSARLGADHVLAPVLQADHRPERMQQWRPAAEVLCLVTAARPAMRPAVRHVPASVSGAALDMHPHALLLPTWLLNPPRRLLVQGNRPCHHGLLRLLAGPHRFEAGWWSAMEDGEDPARPGAGLALRDYFVAHNDVAGLVWVFRERLAPVSEGTQALARPHRWFLQGVFG
ncbi:protein ImuB [Acidovorax sp. 69]|uniref:Y-family DNA polymerase n=1 Tax=Acidovorax sp. 69 TaxID=2035202 RepID=UPI000C2378E2|nr:DNA polymerase Y family protein [Acidovorax sp. 69]PJI97776.1 protein ImuB [Acidovorax sp. 69]